MGSQKDFHVLGRRTDHPPSPTVARATPAMLTCKNSPNYSEHNCDVKQEQKSYDIQKFTPNHSKHNCDVTSTNFNPVKLRNGEICPEYSQKKLRQ